MRASGRESAKPQNAHINMEWFERKSIINGLSLILLISVSRYFPINGLV